MKSAQMNALMGEFRTELRTLADWWLAHSFDYNRGGFIGEISNDNVKRPDADKGFILNARLLWFFSEAARFTGISAYRSAAERAFEYLLAHFQDQVHGGVFWLLDANGRCLQDRKQTYAQAFMVYGLSAYYLLSENDTALNTAQQIFELLETHAHDDQYGGYLEAFSRDWQPLADRRLSDKDLNSWKSMNTHLHVLEAYTALYRVRPAAVVENALRRCLGYFDAHIIDKHTHHLRMFLGRQWQDESVSFSYGHDIECSWLLWEAVSALRDPALSAYYRPQVLAMAAAVLNDGRGVHGEILDGIELSGGRINEDRVWWVQAEGLVGFLNAYVLSGDEQYATAFTELWQFIGNYQMDRQQGEWHWLSTLDLPRRGDYKMGFWKAPYHNGRAMMAVCRLLLKIAE